MSIDLKFAELTADVLQRFFIKYIPGMTCMDFARASINKMLSIV